MKTTTAHSEFSNSQVSFCHGRQNETVVSNSFLYNFLRFWYDVLKNELTY
ncbi:hypothetical protein HMPREF9554_01411 [Treponema phagedenis F0421]|nr:hypothetical protein HMPREF9554_01411 [Treponema phagedenis F0421]